MPMDVFGCYHRAVGGATGIWWVEAMDTAEHHTMHRAALITEIIWSSMPVVLPLTPTDSPTYYSISVYLLCFFFKILKFQAPSLENLLAWWSAQTWVLKHADESGVGGPGSSPSEILK